MQTTITKEEITCVAVSCSTSIFVIIVASIFLLKRKTLYPDGKFPSVTPRILGLCIAYGVFHVFNCATLITWFGTQNRAVLIVNLLAMGAGEISFLSLFCFHFITWISIVYIDKGKINSFESTVQKWHITAYTLVTILVILGTFGRISVLVLSPDSTDSQLMMMRIGYLALAIPCLALSLGYVVCWRKMSNLVNSTVIDPSQKGKNTEKLTRITMIFVICLTLHSTYYLMCAIQEELSNLNVNSLHLLFLYVLPELAAELTTLYYFGPYDPYRRAQAQKYATESSEADSKRRGTSTTDLIALGELQTPRLDVHVRP